MMDKSRDIRKINNLLAEQNRLSGYEKFMKKQDELASARRELDEQYNVNDPIRPLMRANNNRDDREHYDPETYRQRDYVRVRTRASYQRERYRT